MRDTKTDMRSLLEEGGLEIAASTKEAALNSVSHWSEEHRLAEKRRNGLIKAATKHASMREVADAAGVSPQTVSNICK